MTKQELNQFIHPTQLKRKGKTLMAIYDIFLNHMDAVDAADKHGISRQAVNMSYNKISDRLLEAGWRMYPNWQKGD